MGKAAGFALIEYPNASHENRELLATYLETYHYEDKNGKQHLIPIENVRKRCRRFLEVVYALGKFWEPDLIVTELDIASFDTHANGAVSTMAHMNGVLYVIADQDVPIIVVNVSSWQSIILHYKRGDDMKVLSTAYALEHFGVTVSDHVSDAICLCDAAPYFLQLVEQDAKAVRNKVRLYK
jgi:hypothetical protein